MTKGRIRYTSVLMIVGIILLLSACASPVPPPPTSMLTPTNTLPPSLNPTPTPSPTPTPFQVVVSGEAVESIEMDETVIDQQSILEAHLHRWVATESWSLSEVSSLKWRYFVQPRWIRDEATTDCPVIIVAMEVSGAESEYPEGTLLWPIDPEASPVEGQLVLADPDYEVEPTFLVPNTGEEIQWSFDLDTFVKVDETGSML